MSVHNLHLKKVCTGGYDSQYNERWQSYQFQLSRICFLDLIKCGEASIHQSGAEGQALGGGEGGGSILHMHMQQFPSLRVTSLTNLVQLF